MAYLDALTAVGAKYVTSLGGLTPTDGDRVTYEADASTGILWPFRYRASNGYWEATGVPSPLISVVESADTVNSVGSGTWNDMAGGTPGPLVTLPLDGDYMVEYGCEQNGAVVGATTIMTLGVGNPVAPPTADANTLSGLNAIVQNDSNTWVTGSRKLRYNARSAGDTFKAYYGSYKSGGFASTVVSWRRRWLHVWPIRVH